jgi:hypothetical protein
VSSIVSSFFSAACFWNCPTSGIEPGPRPEPGPSFISATSRRWNPHPDSANLYPNHAAQPSRRGPRRERDASAYLPGRRTTRHQCLWKPRSKILPAIVQSITGMWSQKHGSRETASRGLQKPEPRDVPGRNLYSNFIPKPPTRGARQPRSATRPRGRTCSRGAGAGVGVTKQIFPLGTFL